MTLAAQQGSPIVGIFSMIERPSLYMVTRPEIRSMPELKGKTIGLGSIGGITVTITRRMLANYGINANEFTIVSSGDLPVRLAAVKSGAIHATLAGPPAPVQAKELGLNVLASAADTVDFPFGIAQLKDGIARVSRYLADSAQLRTAGQRLGGLCVSAGSFMRQGRAKMSHTAYVDSVRTMARRLNQQVDSVIAFLPICQRDAGKKPTETAAALVSRLRGYEGALQKYREAAILPTAQPSVPPPIN